MRRGIWQDWVNLVLGAFLVLAPFFGMGAEDPAPMWNSYVSGVLVLVFAWGAIARPQVWEEWMNAVLGLWLIISPFILGYSNLRGVTWAHIIVGLIVGVNALVAMRSPTHTHHPA